MSKNESEKQQSTQSTGQPVNQSGGQQGPVRDQSVDQRLIYQVRKSYDPIERQILEGTNSTQNPTPNGQTQKEQLPRQLREQKADNKQQE